MVNDTVLYSQYRCMMEGKERGNYVDFYSPGLYITVTSFRRRILVFIVQVHNGRGEKGDLFAQIGFPFLWPVYNLLHHSYIVQEKDTCIHSAGAQWKGEKKGDLFGFPFLWPVYNLLHNSYIIQERIIAFTR